MLNFFAKEFKKIPFWNQKLPLSERNERDEPKEQERRSREPIHSERERERER